METAGRYGLQRRLGTAQICELWAARGPDGEPVTVVRVDVAHAGDEAARSRFAFAAGFVAQHNAGAVAGSDLIGPRSWIAFAGEGEEGPRNLFSVMGVQLAEEPAAPNPPAPTWAGPSGTEQTTLMISPSAGVPFPVSGMPYPGSSGPAAGTPFPVSGSPAPGYPAGPIPVSASPFPGQWAPQPPPPAAAPGPRFTFPDPKAKRRRWLVGGLVLLLLVASVAVTHLVTRKLVGGRPVATPSATAAPNTFGVEPPQLTADDWPTFKAADKTEAVTGMTGLGFDFKVAAGWKCTLEPEKAPGETMVSCADPTSPGVDSQTVQIVSRPCTQPCDPDKRTQMRKLEPAWGLQWLRWDSNTSYASSSDVTLGGSKRYVTVLVRYWESKKGGGTDRQLVVRMTGPLEHTADMQKSLANIKAAAKPAG